MLCSRKTKLSLIHTYIHSDLYLYPKSHYLFTRIHVSWWAISHLTNNPTNQFIPTHRIDSERYHTILSSPSPSLSDDACHSQALPDPWRSNRRRNNVAPTNISYKHWNRKKDWSSQIHKHGRLRLANAPPCCQHTHKHEYPSAWLWCCSIS